MNKGNVSRKIPIGVSACLLGERVRYNGAHKRSALIVDCLGHFYQWIPLCPEVEIGLGVPRNPIRLEVKNGEIHLVDTKTHHDYTSTMDLYARAKVETLRAQNVCGLILKSRSPSCGVFNVPVFNHSEMIIHKTSGRFTHTVQQLLPWLPIEENDRLKDPAILDHFLVRVHAYDRWNIFIKQSPNASSLQSFHRKEKMLILAHTPSLYSSLGRLAARCHKENIQEILPIYGKTFMKALNQRATSGKHLNVLYHLIGMLREGMRKDDYRVLQELINAFRNKKIPLSEIRTAILMYARKLHHPWVAEQTYLQPYPAVIGEVLSLEGKLKNH